MRVFIIVSALIFTVAGLNVTTVLPANIKISNKFLGKWELTDSDETLDNYLVAKGLGWLKRTLVKSASITKIFRENADGTYFAKVDTLTMKIVWNNISLDVPFEGDYLDDKKHTITFMFDPIFEKLTEKHVYINDDGIPETDVYEYTLKSNEKMTMFMENKGVSTNRYYKKVVV